MEPIEDSWAPSRPAFPTLDAVVRHARALTYVAAFGVAALTLWLAMRSGWMELIVMAPVAGAVAYFAMRLASEMVALVAETLMPR